MAPELLPPLAARYAVLRGLFRDLPPGAPLDWQDAGVHDPDAGHCVNQHYALSHLMLGAALLHELTGDDTYGSDAAAMAALLARHQAARYAPFDPDSIHWDFNNHAWLSAALLPRAEAVRRHLQDPALGALRRENGTLAGNWLTMRRVNRAFRRRLGLPVPGGRAWLEPWAWRRLFRADGGIDEFPGRSRPLQYHAYVLALMLRQAVTTGQLAAADEKRLHAGLEYLLAHVDAEGRTNWRGRGQYQLFAEGCLRHVLGVTTAWYGAHGGAPACDEALARLSARPWPARPDGLLALVETDPGSERAGTHYDYHHPTVYNAFDLVWRLLTVHDAAAAAGGSLPAPRLAAPAPRFGLHAASGLWVERAGPWLVALAAGEEMYLSDVGLTFCHLGGPRGALFTAPGGPHPSRYGRMHGGEHLRQNVFGPVASALPHFRRGELQRDGDGIRVAVSGEGGRLERRVALRGTTLHVTDDVTLREAPLRHAFHWALPEGLAPRADGSGRYLIGRDGAAPLAVLVFATAPGELRRGEAFRGPGGVVRPWFREAGSGPETVTFTLELLP
jgi:hypothetical protein